MKIFLARSAVLAILLLLALSTLTSQQANQIQRFPQFENEEVAVWRTVIPPNAPLTMHTHQHPRVIIALTGGTMKVIREDGSSEAHDWEANKAYWLSTEQGKRMHSDANQGSKPIEVMVVELKNSKT